jgi:hypothetical protein
VDPAGHVQDKLSVTTSYTGIHTVTEDGNLLFIDDLLKVRKLKLFGYKKIIRLTPLGYKKVRRLISDGTVTTLMTTDRPTFCIHSSRINGDILVGSPRRVTRYDKVGRKLQVIEKDNDGRRLYEFPHYITENYNGDVLISDRVKYAVVGVDKSGRHRFVYKGGPSVSTGRQSVHTGRQSDFYPCGICTDVYGHVLVCNLINPSVHLLDQDGQFLSLLLTEEQHGICYPMALCVDDQKHNLYLGQWYRNTIKVYKYLQDTNVK